MRKVSKLQRLTLGYCVPEFPSQTHAFFWREVEALETLGLQVRIFSTRQPARNLSPHQFSDEARSRTHYLHPPRWRSVLPFLARRPGRVLAAAGYVFSLTEASFGERLRALGFLAVAADLVVDCTDARVGHVHIHSFANAAHIGAIAHILGGLSYSLTLHGDLPVYGTDHARKLQHAAFATAVTEPLRQQISAQAPGTDVQVITMGVDIERFVPAIERVQPVESAPLHIVSVARLNPTKGHTHFLEAMARLVKDGYDLHYSIAGDGPSRGDVAAAVRALELDERVTFLGALAEPRVLSLLQQADLFVLSSYGLGEAAPVAVMEAMACGLPVICSRIGGTADMIEDGQDGVLVAQQDVQALADALVRLADDPALRSRIGKAARRTACAKFDYRLTAAKLAREIRRSVVQDAELSRAEAGHSV